MEGLPDDLTGDDITYFKYAPITSTDVERSFSRYKTLLVDNRRSFNFENIKKSLVVQCNTFEGRNKIISNAFKFLIKMLFNYRQVPGGFSNLYLFLSGI